MNKSYQCNGARLFQFLCILFGSVNLSEAASLSFRFEIGEPMETLSGRVTQVSIGLQFAMSDPGGQAARAGAALLLGEKPANDEEHLNAIRWLMWRSRFPRAQLEAEALVNKTASNHIGALISLAVAQICRADYEAACLTLETIQEKKGPELMQHWYVYLKSTALGQPETVEESARQLIISDAISRSSVAMSAVLSTCWRLKDGRHLFNALRLSIQPDQLHANEQHLRAYEALLMKFSTHENEPK